MTLTQRPGRKPIIQNIAADLRRKIQQQVFDPGQRLPTTVAMSKTYGVSPVTVVKAVNQLKQEGMLQTRSGVGIFVTEPTIRQFEAPAGGAMGQLTTILVSRTQDMMASEQVDESALYLEGLKQQMVSGVQETANLFGVRHHTTIVAQSQFQNRDSQMITALQQARDQSQAIIIACDRMDHELGLWVLEQVDCKVVFLSFENHPMSPLNVVIKDTYYSTYQLLESLIDKGYRKLGCFGAPDRYLGRRRAWRDVHEDRRLVFDEQFYFAAGESTAQINDVAKTIVTLPPAQRPQLVFCYNDFRAMALLEQAKLAGLDVPGELAIAGFDGHPKALKQGITTVGVSAYQKGVNAVILAEALINGKLQAPVCQTVCGQIIWGQTT
jgi:DNA-binding LacI/PurR family transcriptional regulator/DNA-binding transcriptional regulator YhcF (GntR family)